MSLDIYIKYKEPGKHNYYLEHPYYYVHLAEHDLNNYDMEDEWNDNITHNLGEMASHVPVRLLKNDKTVDTTLYKLLWRPDELGEEFMNTDIFEPHLRNAISYMITHRKELLQYEPENGWGTYNGFMKFLLNLLQACQDNPGCKIEVPR